MRYGLYTVDVEKLAGLNFHSFKPTDVFADIFWRFLTQSAYYILKSSTYVYSQENFRGALENHESHESLALRIFPHLRYYLLLTRDLLKGVACRAGSHNME